MTRFRQWLAGRVLRLARWIDVEDGSIPEIDHAPDPLDLSASAIVAQAEALPGAPSGEYRRHYAYAKLIQAHPDRPRTAISLAIEHAVLRLRASRQES